VTVDYIFIYSPFSESAIENNKKTMQISNSTYKSLCRRNGER